MKQIHKPQSVPLKPINKLTTLVENRTIYSLDNFELNIFETHQESQNVHLKFNNFVLSRRS